jgi:ribonuclease J
MIYKHHPRSRGRQNQPLRTPNRPFVNKPAAVASVAAPAGRQDKLRIMVMGGLEEVGRNMTVLEYGPDIIIIDMGLQFPEEDMPGIDYIIPDITYLKDKLKKIRGIIITHGHYDHIGAISHLCPDLGNPPIYTGKLTAGLIKKRHEEYKKNPLDLRVVDPDTDRIKLGVFNVEFFRVNHNIPDSFGVFVNTPVGNVVHTGDFKIDLSPINDKPIDLNRIAQLGGRRILALLADSTDAEHRGHQISEGEITGSIEQIFQEATGRIIFGTFASLINRIQQIITAAEKFGRKVYFDGRSMNSNIEIAHELGYIHYKPDTIVAEDALKKLPDEKVTIVGTGAQGEKNAVLNRIANREHKFLSVHEGDSIVFSSSVIPGNERTIQTLKDTFYKQGARVYHYQMLDIHAGGHAKQEDLKLIIRLFSPKYFVPIEANHYMLRIHGQLAESVGVPKENIFIAANGQVIEFTRGNNETIGRLTEEKVPTEYIMVDGLGVGDISNIVLRDRRMMAEDGMFVVITTVRKQTGELVGSPDIISRGFVYMKESKELIEESRDLVRKIAGKTKKPNFDPMFLKNKLRDKIGELLYKKTKRRPMILPVVIEV